MTQRVDTLRSWQRLAALIGLMVAAVAVVVAASAPAVVALPSGYHYEMVSPPDKEGGNTYSAAGIGGGGTVSLDGDSVAFVSATGFAGIEGSGLALWYRATRGETSWETRGINPPFKAMATGFGDGPHVGPASADMTKVLVCTNSDPRTREAQVRRNVYLRNNVTGSYRLLTPDPVSGPLTYIPNTRLGCGNLVRGYTVDLRYVLIGTSGMLTPDAIGVTGSSKLYLVDTQTGAIELASVTDAGTGFSSGDSLNPGGHSFHKQNLISQDGRYVFAPAGMTLYRRDTVLDQSRVVGTNVTFLDASRDARYVFVRTASALVGQDVNGTEDIYRWDGESAPGSEWTLVTTDSEPADGDTGTAQARTLWVSPSGDRLYFTSSGTNQLVAGAPTAAANHRWYMWDDGTLKYIGSDLVPDALVTSLVSEVHVSPLGSYLAIETHRSSSGLPAAEHQILLYDADASAPAGPDLRCVSCADGGPGETPWRGWFETINLSYQEIGLGGINARPADTNLNMRTRVTDDGAVLFGTASPLLPEDVNGPGQDSVGRVVNPPAPPVPLMNVDTYLYRDGRLDLISSGRDASNSYPYGISADGSTIAFTTRERLSGWDGDHSYDVYVARQGPGLPEPAPSPPDCDGDECQGQVLPAASGRVAATGRVVGRGDATGGPRPAVSLPRVGAGARRRLAAGRPARIAIRVNRPGRLVVVAEARVGGRLRVVGRSVRRAAAAGKVRVRLRLSRAARTRLADGHGLRVRLAVTFVGARTVRTVALNPRRAK